mmetsp:Transcript_7304/g.15978  ORF Transcript_7304/g.15978 Transcript_7304/m.15978 type:complete len:369 (+) Transcript_7304:34-1140(+)
MGLPSAEATGLQDSGPPRAGTLVSAVPAPRRPLGARSQHFRRVGDGDGERLANRLQNEIDSLREAYAKKIANTELRCEQLLREKDTECSNWYKEKRAEILQMRSGCTIMYNIFALKRRKFLEDLTAERHDFKRHMEGFRQEVERLELEKQESVARTELELSERSAAFEAQQASLEAECRQLQAKLQELEEQLSQEQQRSQQLCEDAGEKQNQVEDLQLRLEEALQNEERLRCSSKVEALEAELKRTKRVMNAKRLTEARAFRGELMDYVRYIVNLLPEEQRRLAKNQDFLPDMLVTGRPPSTPRLGGSLEGTESPVISAPSPPPRPFSTASVGFRGREAPFSAPSPRLRRGSGLARYRRQPSPRGASR